MPFRIPGRLARNCRNVPERAAWLMKLPEMLERVQQRWTLTLGDPFDSASCAWVAPARLSDGTAALFKAGMPHMEATHEIAGLQFWNGNPTARVFAADDDLNAMLLERCQPGTALRRLPEPEQDVIVAGLLNRLWRVPPPVHLFRPLSALIEYWMGETSAATDDWSDPGLVRHGLAVFKELLQTTPMEVLLATDLHAGNVLRAEREPWLVIDPKPFVGDPAYDVTQHLFNCQMRLQADPQELIRRVADAAQVDPERVRLWTFARAAADPRGDWNSPLSHIARQLAP
jgi:streptomycin 6-kinase